MSAIGKYLKEVTGKSSLFEAIKATGVYAFCDGKVAETVLCHGPTGNLVGTDHLGNQYFERVKNTQYGRHRWVVYNNKRSETYTASSVPAEWHGWLHHINNDKPTVVVPMYPVYHVPHTPAKTMSSERYLPKGSWVNGKNKRNWRKHEAWAPNN